MPWGLIGLLATLGVAGFVWFGTVDLGSSIAGGGDPSPAEERQQELLDRNLGLPSDPLLGQRFREINVRHFNSALPAIPVRWEPELATVGELAGGRFTLQGMYGYVGNRALILLAPELAADADAIDRVLSHEMVHAYLHAIGNSATTHGPVFQTVLRRLSVEGAFVGVVASDEERGRLRDQLDQEAARLDAEAIELETLNAELERERTEVERALAGLGASTSQDVVAQVVARRDAFNDRAAQAARRAERHARDRESLAAEVTRYQLMIAYPDGATWDNQ